MKVKNDQGKEQSWIIDMKKDGKIYLGDKPKPDVTIIVSGMWQGTSLAFRLKVFFSDDTFTQLSNGTLDGQKAFMTGKLKVRLDTI